MENSRLRNALKEAAEIVAEALPTESPEIRAEAFRIVCQHLGLYCSTKPQGGQRASEKSAAGLSLTELLNKVRPSTFVEKVVVVAYDLSKDKELLTVRDIETGFVQAKLQKPRNISDVINKAIQHGFLAEAREKKDKRRQVYLTQTGREYVEKCVSKARVGGDR